MCSTDQSTPPCPHAAENLVLQREIMNEPTARLVDKAASVFYYNYFVIKAALVDVITIQRECHWVSTPNMHKQIDTRPKIDWTITLKLALTSYYLAMA